MPAGPSLLIRVGLVLIVATAAVGTPADADLWGHVAFGRDLVTSRGVVQTDRYSFTSDRPWVNHEWLAEAAFFDAYRLGGSVGLVLLKLGIIAALGAVVWWRVTRLAPSARARAWLVALAFVGTYWRTHNVRPQLFSVLLFAILLLILTKADEGRRRGLLAVPPLMALWVNLHGGWIVGLGALGLWVAVRSVDWRRPIPDRLTAASVGLASLAATLISPYGLRLWTFLAQTIRPERADIEEWSTVLTSPIALGIPWALILGAGAWAVWRSGWPRRVDYLVLVAGLAVASFRTSRLDAFFALAVVILLAPQLVSAWPSGWQRPEATPARRSGPGPGVIAVTAVTLAAMIVPAALVIAPYARCLEIAGPSWVPPEVEAARFIALNHLKGRMLTWFDWGEYAIWHFGPSVQVSMDGRRETVYSDAVIQAHRRFYAADETAETFLHALDPDYIWVPRRLAIASRLTDPGWTPVFRGSISIIFARAGSGPFRQVTDEATARRCFPGP